ncbi:putative ras-related protein RABF1-like [Capsicum annuum]|uniref:SKP1-like protein 11 n=1 Tax=Capsicum annuum TaxID=4072 RepID=A0A1U8F789_CAPAN|nr:SKP1-like protein 11 [Capsicum annuum]KAF3627248.1 putative ras-related protein RABF1-like [Capsicum annuum]KAF3629067.1 putative ras-related protein RABF1-like [Capsicum annuum]PHT62839.1 hypothetical protein T459_33304 [Capsicum annuum]
MASSSSAPPPSVTIPSLKSTAVEASSSSAPPQSAVNAASSSAAPPPVNIPTLKSTAGEASLSSVPPQGKILTLKSSEEDEFQVEESIAIQSGTIKNMVEAGYTVIPLLNVESKSLIKILDYMIHHAAEKDATNKQQLEEFDKEFVKISFKMMSQLVFAANYLHIPGLMSLLCQTIADKIKNKSIKVVRRIFNITNDYTSEEEAEARREHEWAHNGEFDDTVDDLIIPNEEESDDEDDEDEDDDGTPEEGEEKEVRGVNVGEIEEINE